jgi:hypothetical protein
MSLLRPENHRNPPKGTGLVATDVLHVTAGCALRRRPSILGYRPLPNRSHRRQSGGRPSVNLGSEPVAGLTFRKLASRQAGKARETHMKKTLLTLLLAVGFAASAQAANV